MTREMQLTFCKRCVNRKLDLQQGLLCSLTGEKADFEESCPSFVRDKSVTEVPQEHAEGLDAETLQLQLSPEHLAQLKQEQNLGMGVAAAAGVGLIGAILWGVISVVTGYQIGYMAVGIGAAVGFSMQKVGKGTDQYFGIWSAAISLIAVVLGNMLSLIALIAKMQEVTLTDALLRFDYALLPSLMAETFSMIDLLFYGLALYEGYRFAFRKITAEDVARYNGVDPS